MWRSPARREVHRAGAPEDAVREIPASHPVNLERLPVVRQEPFEVIVARHGPMVPRVCRAVLGHTATAEAARRAAADGVAALREIYRKDTSDDDHGPNPR